MPPVEPIPTSLEDLSQINFGLVIDGRVPKELYKSEWFYPPYDRGIQVLLQKGAVKEDVAQVLSPEYINEAHESVVRWNGIGETFNWAKALETAYNQWQMGDRLQKMSKKLKANEPVDILPLYADLSAALSNTTSGLQRLSDVGTDYKPFKLTGMDAFDKTLGGIPSDGPIIIMMMTGVGKSKLATALINSLLHKYQDDTAAVYTLEMNEKHWKWRAMNLFPTLRDVQDRLHISGAVRDIDELVAEVTAGRFQYVVLDDMDNIVKSQDAAEYERVYRRVKEVCRFMGIPFFVLAQPNRAAKLAIAEGTRFPQLYDSAWSGASENSAALFIAGHTCDQFQMHSEEFPTDEKPMDYLIAWKSRDGWPADYDPTKFRGPGAIIMEHSPNWNGRPYRNAWKLWSPDSSGKAIGLDKKKKEK